MSKNKVFDSLIRVAFPSFAIFFSLVSFACIFDTINLSFSAALYNLLLLLPMLGISLALFRRFDLAAFFASAVAFMIYYADALVYSLRLTHIRLSDFMLLGQAFRVANRYQPVWSSEMTRRLLIAGALCGFLTFLEKYYRLKYSKKAVCLTGLGFIAVGITVFFFGLLPHNFETFDFNTDAERNGLIYSWYCQYHESKLRTPEGYSNAKANEILSSYVPTDGNTDTNIIVVMNESLADYSLLGVPPFDDPLPNLHEYKGNAFYGKLAVSVFGGGTPNTEYEFLTGNAMAFLPDGATPFLQYVIGDENSIARDVAELDYRKIAIHPYYSEEWNRTQVYKFLGFDRFISGVDFGNTVVTNGIGATTVRTENMISFGDGPMYVRGLISDQTCLERVLEESSDRSFIFAVTMQNHGGYAYSGEDFINRRYVTEKDIIPIADRPKAPLQASITDAASEVYSINQYLTCTNLSDAAFKALTDALEASDKKTVVLMFGDHQPSLFIPGKYMKVDDFNEATYYTVPYILWANYDIKFDAPEYTSPNFLSAILKKNAGLPLTAWDQFRLDVMQEYPVVTANFIFDKKGARVEADVLKNYAYLQYYRMFDAGR